MNSDRPIWEKDRGPAPKGPYLRAYNQWQALGSCLESLSTQSDAPSFEVIVVDDGSSHPQDLTIVLVSFRLLQLRQPHGGVSVVRNYGARICENVSV